MTTESFGVFYSIEFYEVHGIKDRLQRCFRPVCVITGVSTCVVGEMIQSY